MTDRYRGRIEPENLDELIKKKYLENLERLKKEKEVSLQEENKEENKDGTPPRPHSA